MTSHLRVSVVVPCRNYGAYLSDCIASLQQQSETNWECWIVDDGSTDDTWDRVQQFSAHDTRVHGLQLDGVGPSAARNAGLARCAGQYLQFLDADDALQPEKLGRQADWLDHHSEVSVVYGSVELFSGSVAAAMTRPYAPADDLSMHLNGQDEVAGLLTHNVVFLNAALSRRQDVLDCGGFRAELGGCEDWDLWLRMCLAGRHIAYQDFPAARALVRLHPGSLTTDPRRMLQGAVQMRAFVDSQLLPGPVQVRNAQLLSKERSALWFYDGLHGPLWASTTQLFLEGLAKRRVRDCVRALALPLLKATRVVWQPLRNRARQRRRNARH